MTKSINHQASAITDLLKSAFRGRRAMVGVAFQSDADVLEQLLLEPHRFIVFGDRFHPMFRVMTRCMGDGGGRLKDDLVFLETSFKQLPLRPESLDALVLLGGLPILAASSLSGLMQLRLLLKPGGMIIWPQPLDEGFFSPLALARYAAKKGFIGAAHRPSLCRLAMEAGFVEIGQTALKKNVIPWTLTFARSGNRPWVRTTSSFSR